MTLERVVEIALERAPQLQAQRAQLESANERAISAGRLPDPELVFGVDNLPINGADAWSATSDFMTMRKIGVMQEVPNAAKRNSERQLAQSAIHVIEAQARVDELAIAQDVAVAWVELMSAQRLIANLATLKSELELQAKAIKGAVSAGRASTIEALATRDAVLDIDDRALETQRQARVARASLARWIGDAAQTLEPAGEPSFAELTPEQEQAIATLHQHAALLAFDAQIDAARNEVELARASKRPDWAAGLSFAKRGDAFSDMVSIEFRIGLPLFAGSRQDPEIRAKQAAVRRLEAERETDLRMHAEEIAQMLASWQTTRARLQLLERERFPLAQARRKSALASYRSGGASLNDALESVRAEIELQQRHAELSVELGRAWTYLRYLQPRQTP
jgi:outer membrane protein TolC